MHPLRSGIPWGSNERWTLTHLMVTRLKLLRTANSPILLAPTTIARTHHNCTQHNTTSHASECAVEAYNDAPAAWRASQQRRRSSKMQTAKLSAHSVC